MSASKTEVEALLSSFLDKPQARAAQSIRDRMLYWKDVANNPETNLRPNESGPAAIAARRKVALQSLRKLIERNPSIAAQLQSETKEAA